MTPVDLRRGVRELFLKRPREWPRRYSLASQTMAMRAWRLPVASYRAEVLGHADANRVMRACREQIEELVIEEDDLVRLQPYQLPVRDTAARRPRCWRRAFVQRTNRSPCGRVAGRARTIEQRTRTAETPSSCWRSDAAQG